MPLLVTSTTQAGQVIKRPFLNRYLDRRKVEEGIKRRKGVLMVSSTNSICRQRLRNAVGSTTALKDGPKHQPFMRLGCEVTYSRSLCDDSIGYGAIG